MPPVSRQNVISILIQVEVKCIHFTLRLDESTLIVFIEITTVTTDSTYHFIAPGAVTNGYWNDYPNYPDLALCEYNDWNQAIMSAPFHGKDIATTCCLLDGSYGVRPDCNAHPVTYHQALALCESHGYRLCTLQELLHDEVSKYAGCNYNRAFNWVSDECNDQGMYHCSSFSEADVFIMILL